MSGWEGHRVPLIVLAEVDELPAEAVGELASFGAELSSVPRLNLSPSADALLAGTVALHGLVTTVDYLRRALRRGVVIEDRDGQVVVRSDPGLPRGTTVVKADGEALEVRETQQLPQAVLDWLQRRGG